MNFTFYSIFHHWSRIEIFWNIELNTFKVVLYPLTGRELRIFALGFGRIIKMKKCEIKKEKFMNVNFNQRWLKPINNRFESDRTDAEQKNEFRKFLRFNRTKAIFIVSCVL